MRNASCCCGLKLTEKTIAGQNAETMSWCSVGPNWDSLSQGSGTPRKRRKSWRMERYGCFLDAHSHELTHCIWSYLHTLACRDFITGERCYNALFILEILEVLWLHPCQFLRFIDVSTPEESKCILGLFLASGRTSDFTEIVSRIPADTSLGPLKPLLISTSVKNERSREETRKFKELEAASVSYFLGRHANAVDAVSSVR